MGFFGPSVRDIRGMLGDVTPGVQWDVDAFADDPGTGIFFGRLPKTSRLTLPNLSIEQASFMAEDVWRVALRNRPKLNFGISIEADSGQWANIGFSYGDAIYVADS